MYRYRGSSRPKLLSRLNKTFEQTNSLFTVPAKIDIRQCPISRLTTVIKMDDQLFKISIEFHTLDEEERFLSFTFMHLPKGSRMLVKPTLMPHIMKLTDQKDFIHAACITKAQTTMGRPLNKLFKNYYVIFFTNKESGEKRGIMVSFNEDGEGQVNGAWPTSFRDSIITNPGILKDAILALTTHPELYENLNVITEVIEA